MILIYAPIAINRTRQIFEDEDPEQIVNQEDFSDHDPKQIVIDEVLGMFIPLLFLSLAFQMPNLPGILKNITTTIWFSDEITISNRFYVILYFKHFIILNFILFRFFDIIKPFPIGYVDKKFKNPFGVIFDDILAGLYCILLPYILVLISYFLNFLEI